MQAEGVAVMALKLFSDPWRGFRSLLDPFCCSFGAPTPQALSPKGIGREFFLGSIKQGQRVSASYGSAQTEAPFILCISRPQNPFSPFSGRALASTGLPCHCCPHLAPGACQLHSNAVSAQVRILYRNATGHSHSPVTVFL